MNSIFKFILFSVLTLGMGFKVLAIDPNKPDLRDGTCVNCKGNANNYSILNVYFSNSSGSPNDVCATSGPYFISILYTSNANSSIHNFRLIADILKKDRVSNNVINEYYMNHFVGTVPPCSTGTCIITVPLPAGFTVDCNNEYYELNNPMVAWTNNNNNNLRDSYRCQNYPAAQCLNQPSIPIEVGTLAYSFGPVFACFQEDLNQTNVSFVITSLFGGNPTLGYNVSWSFQLPNGTTQTSTSFNPTVWNLNEGSQVTATLTVTQGSISGSAIVNVVTVPSSLNFEDVILNVTSIDSDEDRPTGVIDVTFKEGDYFYFWSSLDYPGFYSEESKIESLSPGTYRLTTIDNETGTCRIDEFDIAARILPVEMEQLKAHFLNESRSTKITWSTTKEWESSHFEIERSLQGLNFEKIGEVNAAGWSNILLDYFFEDDKLPLGSANILYRIKQVDLMGNFHYSKILSVRTIGVEFTTGVWRAYPNPSRDNKLRISLLDSEQYDDEVITFRLIHPSAQTQAMAVRSESEMNEQLSQMITRIPKGVFVVEIQWGQKVEHIKVLKQ